MNIFISEKYLRKKYSIAVGISFDPHTSIVKNLNKN